MRQDCQDQSKAAHTPLTPPKGVSLHDYDMIEDAVMETARGRWFLKEYARRMRAAETAGLLGALQRIEAMVASRETAQPLQVSGSQDASERIGSASEKLLDVVWYMRERGFESSICEAVDTEARVLAELAGQMGCVSGFEPATDATGLRASLFEPKRPAEICLEARVDDDVAALGAVRAEAPLCESAHAVASQSVPSKPVLEIAEPAIAKPAIAETAFSPANTARVEDVCPATRAGVAWVGTGGSPVHMTINMQLAALAHIDAMPLPRKLALFA